MTFFIMNPNAVLYIGGLAAIAAVMILVAYPLAGLEGAISSAVVFGDFAQVYHVPDSHHIHPFPIGNMTLNPDGTMTVTFKGGHDPYSNREIHFSHVETYAAGESFVRACEETEEGAYLFIFTYLGAVTINQTRHIALGEYDALTQEPMQCAYPDVIAHSRNAVEFYSERGQTMLFLHTEQLLAIYEAAGDQDNFERTIEEFLRGEMGLHVSSVSAGKIMEGPIEGAERAGEIYGSVYDIPRHLKLVQSTEWYREFMNKYGAYPVEFSMYDERPWYGFKYEFTHRSGHGESASTFFRVFTDVPLVFDEFHYTLACDDGEHSIIWRGQEAVEQVLNSDEFCGVP